MKTIAAITLAAFGFWLFSKWLTRRIDRQKADRAAAFGQPHELEAARERAKIDHLKSGRSSEGLSRDAGR